jgi:deoxyribonuclease IV
VAIGILPATIPSFTRHLTIMPLLGSHLSIAGGYYKAVDAAAELKMDCVQIFTKNNNQWRGKVLSAEDVTLFRKAIERTGIRMPCGHDSYLINLASPSETLWKQSLEAFVVEIERAEALGLVGLVIHPGSRVDSTEEEGLRRIVRALDEALKRTPQAAVEIWLETTAGQGSSLGHRFEHLRTILDGVKERHRLGVCIDSCHIFAAGYPLGSPEDYQATLAQFDAIVGLRWVRAFHLNDSKRELGSRVDRHEHIGKGHLGREAFRNILNDPRFASLPMYLETRKGIVDGRSLDAMNLAVLRRLMKPRPANRKTGKAPKV